MIKIRRQDSTAFKSRIVLSALEETSHSATYPLNSIFMPTRPEPENNISQETLPAPSSQHGPAQHRQPPGPTQQTQQHTNKSAKKRKPVDLDRLTWTWIDSAQPP